MVAIICRRTDVVHPFMTFKNADVHGNLKCFPPAGGREVQPQSGDKKIVCVMFSNR